LPEPKAESLTATVLAIFKANGQLISWGDRFVAPFGLTSARWQMLGALAFAGEPIATPRIAYSMGVTRQGARKQLNLLLAEGLVCKRHNPFHKRSPLYELTDEGRRTYEAVQAAWNEHAKSLSGSLSQDDLETTLRTLARLSDLHSQPGEVEDDEG